MTFHTSFETVFVNRASLTGLAIDPGDAADMATVVMATTLLPEHVILTVSVFFCPKLTVVS